MTDEHTLPTIDVDAATDAVYKKAIAHLQNGRVPLNIAATKQELRAAVKGMVEGMLQVDLATLIPDGPVKEAMHPLYLKRLAALTLSTIASQEAEALAVLEEERKEELEQMLSEQFGAPMIPPESNNA